MSGAAIPLPAPAGIARVLVGAGTLSAATLAAGVLTYAFHVLAARTLGAEAYGQVAVLWAAMFVVVVILWRPLEQTVSRGIADRTARGHEAVSVVRCGALVGAVVLGALGVLALAAWRPLTDRLFLGDGTYTAMLLAGIAVYGAVYLVRGVAGGTRWFSGLALTLTSDTVARLALAAPLVLVASTGLAAAAVASAGLAAVVVPLALGSRRLRRELGGAAAARFRPGSAFAFAAPAGVIAAADQLLVNGGPLLVMAAGGTDAAAAAGVVFAATMLVRVPVFLFQGVAASVLPNLAHVHAADGPGALGGGVRRLASALLLAGVVMTAGAAAVGPECLRLVYGDGFVAGRLALALLGAGAACYLAAALLSQTLLALGRAPRAAAAWSVAAGLFVALYALLPGDDVTRVGAALAASSCAALVLLARLVTRPLARR